MEQNLLLLCGGMLAGIEEDSVSDTTMENFVIVGKHLSKAEKRLKEIHSKITQQIVPIDKKQNSTWYIQTESAPKALFGDLELSLKRQQHLYYA
ncbi:unnamed protein product [Leptidea sinapis]|uniref:Uncharacterized protein n=1 Tax=Leptidea sinapis TaxID=189913 RepID=A0A5E4Q310_9NEOP|nr:unnamed protein product [Leptidea sinapis]